MDKTEKLKPSRYNHFVESNNGKRLAFNAMSCGLAEMDDEHFAVYQALTNGGLGVDAAKHDELIKNLKMGGFLVPADVDELDAIRAGHYRARFGNTGFGLTIIPTVNCNFACDYCYENSDMHSTPAKQGGVMSDEVCDNLVKLCEKRIAEKSNFSVTWYGGEPLLGKSIIGKLTKEFIRICDEKQSEYHAGIITNGYLLTPENVKFLIDSRVSFAQVTIDGPREIHDQRRCLKTGGGTYDRIMGNLDNIDDDTGLNVAIRINVDKRNENRVSELLEDLKRRAIHQRKNISLSFGHVLQSTGSCPDISTTCMVTPEFSNFLVDIYKTAIDMGFRQTSYPSLMLSSCGGIGCDSALIEPNGTVQNCWETVGLEDKRTGILGPEGIQYEDNYIKWLGWSPFSEECTSCDVMPLCMSGCPNRSLYPTGLDKCVSWKYNLSRVLPLMKLAQERQLLSHPRDACSIETKDGQSQTTAE